MGNRFRISWAVLAALALTLLGTGGATAQTQTINTDVLMFEVIAVDGNNVVVRDQNGTRALTVPEDFKFTVDGKSMSVHDLKPGMKGSATVTTTTTSRPVYVTEVKKGVVTRQIGTSVTVRTEQGLRRFTQSELDKRGVDIYMEGQRVKVTELKEKRPVDGNHRHARAAGDPYREGGAGYSRCSPCSGRTRHGSARRNTSGHRDTPRRRYDGDTSGRDYERSTRGRGAGSCF